MSVIINTNYSAMVAANNLVSSSGAEQSRLGFASELLTTNKAILEAAIA